MIEAAVVFATQMVYVFLLGKQSCNVRDRMYVSAMVTSTLLGMAGLYMTSAIARVSVNGGGTWIYVAYIAAGPIGIVCAMGLHDRMAKKSD